LVNPELDLDAAVEVHDLREILRPQFLREADRRFLRILHALLHAGARVDQQRQRDGRLVRLKYVSSCFAPSSKTEKVILPEIGDRSGPAYR
jgi:hypothetical protein